MSRQRVPVLALLAGREHDYGHTARSLLHALELTHHFDLDVSSTPDALRSGGAKVLIAASDAPLEPEHADLVAGFVRRGGGAVFLHSTLAAWADQAPVAEMAGWLPGGSGPLTELIVRSVPGHPITDRLPAEMALEDELYLAEGPPSEATVLLRASWRFTDQVVAYERAYGDGRFVYLGLGHGKAFANPEVQRFVHRAALHAAGVAPQPPVGVGLVGYGAIARLHASSVTATPGLKLQAVCDVSADRRETAQRELGVSVHPNLREMLRDPEVGLVVVGTPPSAHADPVVEALTGGRHVVCEKPFAIRVDEVDRMMDAAAAHERVLTVYQSRRWDPDFLALRDVVRSGSIGKPFYMESFIGGYSHPCDYWHSHEPISGGTIYDWGSHYFDWVLQLFGGQVTAVTATAHKRVWHDVTNADQVRVDLTFADGEQATFMQSDIAAALKPKWYLLGTAGAVIGDWRLVEGEAPADHPARLTVSRPGVGGVHEEHLALAPRDEHGFYRNLADHLAWDEKLAVAPEEARRTVAVMEAATQSIAQGGVRLETHI
jgi:scyllo-inositol 2-dehydrogenase (NADP+)